VSRDWSDERRHLLQVVQNIGGAGRAEGESPDRIAPGFHPVPEHLRLLDSEVVLVVGPRGSGKTEIARVLTDVQLHDAVARYAPAVRLPAGRSSWIRAYPAGAEGFEAIGLRAFIQSQGTTSETLQRLWFAYLVRTLSSELDARDGAELSPLVERHGAEVESIVAIFQELGTRPVVALDRLDARLKAESRFVFVTYDELDVLGGGEWSLVEAAVRGLVALWATYARRWQRVRAKLFLRTDLYDRHARAGGADLAKLAAGRVDLVWNDRDLYGLLLKRLANVDETLARYVQEVRGIKWDEDPSLGRIPRLQRWQDAAPVVERMVGSYMGANRKKGLVYRWLLDHVRDGLGRGFPRPFVRLIEEAARQELQSFGVLRHPRLLEPSSLRRSLDRVSDDHVAQSRDEWPWLDAVKARLAADPLVPWQRERDITALLEGFSGDGARPPFEGRDLLQYLLDVGILRRRPDGRVDAPDLFLSGLGLRRKGGVKKRG
jgi:energy-coupling factor transporter ATP-binding protein EcfA2